MVTAASPIALPQAVEEKMLSSTREDGLLGEFERVAVP
jgi:hypothetical protein